MVRMDNASTSWIHVRHCMSCAQFTDTRRARALYVMPTEIHSLQYSKHAGRLRTEVVRRLCVVIRLLLSSALGYVASCGRQFTRARRYGTGTSDRACAHASAHGSGIRYNCRMDRACRARMDMLTIQCARMDGARIAFTVDTVLPDSACRLRLRANKYKYAKYATARASSTAQQQQPHKYALYVYRQQI